MGKRWAAVVVLSLAACAGSSPVADTASSGLTPTSAPITSASGVPTTTDGTPTDSTTTMSPAAPGSWIPPCRESLAPASPAALTYDGTAEQFGPLGAVPALDVVLPAIGGARPDGTAAQVRAVARSVNGGALVGLSSDGSDEADSSVLSVVQTDGTKRWVRCLAGNAVDAWVAAPARQPTTALVATYRNTTSAVATWELVALDTGQTTGGFNDAAQRAGIDPSILTTSTRVADFSSTAVLLVRTAMDSDTATRSPDLVLRYDLVDESFTVVPDLGPEESARSEYRLGSDDDVVATNGASGVVAVYHGGGWHRDDASRLAARPIEVRFNVAEDPSQANGLEGIDALGAVVWRNDEITDPRLEGVGIVTDGPVTLANVCLAPHPDFSCDHYELVGVDTATGAVDWRLAGLRAVVTAADGWALVAGSGPIGSADGPASAPGYVMVDDRTGTPVDDTQRWQAGAFTQGCCGEGEYFWAERAGGVIFAAAGDHLRVWYPRATSDGTATVSLP